jgi:tRNA (cmo5U34)-methyltransferase
VKLSEWFLKDGTTVYDLGCSTGETIVSMLSLDIDTKFSIVGIDQSDQMLNLAKKKTKPHLRDGINIDFQNIDLTKNPIFKESNLFISILTFPFISFQQREELLKNIYNSLEKGGALICVEKVRSEFSQTEDMLNQLYFDFKLEQELTEEEILEKAKSLRSSMYLDSHEILFNSLLEAGFTRYETFFKCFNFVAYIAIK